MAFKYTKGYENYAKFPMHYLRITQSYNAGNHKPHWDKANYKDYPVDLGGLDSGRDYLYAPVDMKIVALNGIGNPKVSNKIFLESVNKVKTPNCGTTKIFMTAVHFEDSDVSKFGLKVGKIIKMGEIICLEGKETASANHLHLTCGIGNSTKSIQNNNGKWVTKGNCQKPEDIFYIDKNFTIIKDNGGLKFKMLPALTNIEKVGSPIARDQTKNQIEILVTNLRLRSSSSTKGKVLGYIKKGFYNYTDVKQNDNYTWYKIENGWVAFDNNWCRLYKKEEVPLPAPDIVRDIEQEEVVIPEEQSDNKSETKKESFFTKIISLIKKLFSFLLKR